MTVSPNLSSGERGASGRGGDPRSPARLLARLAADLADPLVVVGAVLLLDRLAALLADLEVVLGAELLLHLRPADLANLGEEVRAALLRDRLAALLADVGEETGPVFLLDRVAADAAGFLDGHVPARRPGHPALPLRNPPPLRSQAYDQAAARPMLGGGPSSVK